MSAHDEIDTAAILEGGGVGRLRIVEELCAALDALRLDRDKAQADADKYKHQLGTIEALCIYDYGPCAEFSDAVLAVIDAEDDDDETVCVPEVVTQSMIDSLANMTSMSGVREIRVKTEDDDEDRHDGPRRLCLSADQPIDYLAILKLLKHGQDTDTRTVTVPINLLGAIVNEVLDLRDSLGTIQPADASNPQQPTNGESP